MNSFVIPPQIKADRRLLKFDTYEDYLDNFLSSVDECYLQNLEVSRQIAEFGYRSAGETLTRKQFELRRTAVLNYNLPDVNINLASGGMVKGNELQKELAVREKANRLGILSTIIFLRETKPNGAVCSGYIDYADRLFRDRTWWDFFHGDKILSPKKSDLGYYNWKTGHVVSNNTPNYTVHLTTNGMKFRNRFDRQLVNPAPNECAGSNTFTHRIRSKDYGLIVILDHVVRQRI